jgi:hypothetical protein
LLVCFLFSLHFQFSFFWPLFFSKIVCFKFVALIN